MCCLWRPSPAPPPAAPIPFISRLHRCYRAGLPNFFPYRYYLLPIHHQEDPLAMLLAGGGAGLAMLPKREDGAKVLLPRVGFHQIRDRLLLFSVVHIKGDDLDAVIPDLLAAGEATCASVHGANGLGANSLLDIVVFGRACANRVAAISKPGEKQKPLEKDAGEKTIAWLDKLRNANGSLPTSKIRLKMQRVMQNNVIVFHTQETLVEGIQTLIETIELENLLINACVTMCSAEARKESVGVYSREDFMTRDDDKWMKHLLGYWENKKVRLEYRPVHMNTLDDEIQTFPLKARVY